MSDIQVPPVLKASALAPVNPLIEEYMGGLLAHLDNPVLLEMELLAQKNNFPIVGLSLIHI